MGWVSSDDDDDGGDEVGPFEGCNSSCPPLRFADCRILLRTGASTFSSVVLTDSFVVMAVVAPPREVIEVGHLLGGKENSGAGEGEALLAPYFRTSNGRKKRRLGTDVGM